MIWIPVLLLALAMVLAIGGVWSVRHWPDALRPQELTALVRKNMRRIWILLAGSTIILVGVVIAPLPGPGLVILGPLGLALIATEYAWARRLLKEIKDHSSGMQTQVDRLAAKTAMWALPFVWVSYWAAVVLILRYIPEIPAWLVWPVASGGFTPVLLLTWRVVKTSRAARRAGQSDASTAGQDAQKRDAA